MEKLRIIYPIIVEGRYDKIKLSSLIEGTVITTDGFALFKNSEKLALLRRLAKKTPVIVLTDSDGGGKQIRKFLSGILPADKIHNVYIPKVAGKESRKRKPSKSGTLGVEGMEKEIILRLLAPFTDDQKPQNNGKTITKVDFFEDKLTGHPNSSDLRQALCRECDLPDDMTPNALLEAMNLLYGYDEYKRLVSKLFE